MPLSIPSFFYCWVSRVQTQNICSLSPWCCQKSWKKKFLRLKISLPCLKNNLNLCIKTAPVMGGWIGCNHATVFVWLLSTYCIFGPEIRHTPLHLLQLWQTLFKGRDCWDSVDWERESNLCFENSYLITFSKWVNILCNEKRSTL